VPLTGEGGDIRGDVNKGRVNVAFTRARMQVHCFVSMPVEEIPDQIWIKKYLEHVDRYGEVVHQTEQLNPFESLFEEEFYQIIRSLLPEQYRIQNQVKSCGFRVDFVISNTKNGRRLAIECDGPTHFKDELDEELGIYIETDEERQRVLEAAGWNFYRLRYSDWLNENFDRKNVARDLIKLLC
jgi:very-short-patch-repair endonuclease